MHVFFFLFPVLSIAHRLLAMVFNPVVNIGKYSTKLKGKGQKKRRTIITQSWGASRTLANVCLLLWYLLYCTLATTNHSISTVRVVFTGSSWLLASRPRNPTSQYSGPCTSLFVLTVDDHFGSGSYRSLSLAHPELRLALGAHRI